MDLQSHFPALVNRLSAKLSATGISRSMIFDYSALLSGQVGRLVFSMIYFVVLARALTLGDFGIFASCSAIGIVLSRVLSFGFVSPLFRVATTKPNLIGCYTSGFLILSLISLPVIMLLAGGIYISLYSNLIPYSVFVWIVMAEVICWRGMETVIIVCNGQNRYTTGSLIGIAAVAIKALAAASLFWLDKHTIEHWAPIYFGAQFFTMLVAIIGFYPKQRLRWKPRAWMGRMRDAIGVCTAETLFYLQSELDKVLVLALGGEVLAGLYAIVMRLVDLTAVPLRALSTMLTQWIMRARRSGKIAQTGLKLDAGIGLVSVIALLSMALLLSFAPNLLGKNIATGVSFLWAVALVPAFRNSIELHTDLLYGHERMAARVMLLVYLGIFKAALLTLLLGYTNDFAVIAVWLNVVFALLYCASALVTYGRVLKQQPQSSSDQLP